MIITSVNLLSKWHPSEQCQPVLVKDAPIHTRGNTTGKLHPHLITICLFYFRVYVCVPVWVSGYDVHTFPIWLWANNVGTGTRTPGTWKSRMYSKLLSHLSSSFTLFLREPINFTCEISICLYKSLFQDTKVQRSQQISSELWSLPIALPCSKIW